MNDRTDHLIDTLVADLRPVAPLKRSTGAMLVLVALAATVAAVGLWTGLQPGLAAGVFTPLFVVANGLFLLLGLASATAVIAMAMPRVGRQHDGPKWAMASVALLPLAAIVTSLASGWGSAPLVAHGHDLACLALGSVFALVVAGVLLFWLKRGAPVSLGRAGLYLGVAAGALGSFAYGLSCPLVTIAHLGIWHVLPVAVWALIGRLFVPRLLAW